MTAHLKLSRDLTRALDDYRRTQRAVLQARADSNPTALARANGRAGGLLQSINRLRAMMKAEVAT